MNIVDIYNNSTNTTQTSGVCQSPHIVCFAPFGAMILFMTAVGVAAHYSPQIAEYCYPKIAENCHPKITAFLYPKKTSTNDNPITNLDSSNSSDITSPLLLQDGAKTQERSGATVNGSFAIDIRGEEEKEEEEEINEPLSGWTVAKLKAWVATEVHSVLSRN